MLNNRPKRAGLGLARPWVMTMLMRPILIRNLTIKGNTNDY